MNQTINTEVNTVKTPVMRPPTNPGTLYFRNMCTLGFQTNWHRCLGFRAFHN